MKEVCSIQASPPDFRVAVRNGAGRGQLMKKQPQRRTPFRDLGWYCWEGNTLGFLEQTG